MGKSTEPTFTGRNGAGRLLPSCFKRRSLGPAAVAQPSDNRTNSSNVIILVVVVVMVITVIRFLIQLVIYINI